jgi:hypothetical protein
MDLPPRVKFDGKTYDPALDHDRLRTQLGRVYALMIDGRWRTLYEIAGRIRHGSEAAVSARLRDLRKPRFGSYRVLRRRCDPDRTYSAQGTWEYRVLKPLDLSPEEQRQKTFPWTEHAECFVPPEDPGERE